MSLKYVSIPTKQLSQNLSSIGTTLYLNNTLGWDGDQLTSANFGTQAFAALRNASNTQVEFVEIDPATVTSASAITILKRGLGYDGAQTAAAESTYNWNAFDTYVELGSDVPQMFQFLKDYIDAALIVGGANATTSLQGFTELATQAEYDAGTATGGTGASLVATPAIARGKKYNDYAVDSVGTDSYAITITPAITAYAAGQIFTFKAGTANTGGATLAVSGLTAKTLKKNYNEALVTGDILAGQIVICSYDSVNDCFQVLSKLPAVAPTVHVYTSSSTWSKPANLKYIIVEVVGGGGGGGGSTTATNKCGGGGGGGYSKELIAAATLGATEDYAVGAAGAAGAGTGGTGGTGGTSSFGTAPYLQATGGVGGTDGVLGGVGGTGSNGDINSIGQPGEPGSTITNTKAGGGGNSCLGGGGLGSIGVARDGTAGYAYGGGGGGGDSQDGGDRPGGAGAAGVVIVTEYYS